MPWDEHVRPMSSWNERDVEGQRLEVARDNPLEPRQAARHPRELRLHPALGGLSGLALLDESCSNDGLDEGTVRVTTDGIVLEGFLHWQTALLKGQSEINCLEYELGPEKALSFILHHHRPRRGWIDFIRIRLALTLEPYFKQIALENQRLGGKRQGLTNLSEAERIDVRRTIADLAGSGTTQVYKVKVIFLNAHPNLIAALENGVISIHQVWQWCKLGKAQQKIEFERFEEERIRRKILRESEVKDCRSPTDSLEVIAELRRLEAEKPGSITIRKGRSKRTIVTLGKDLLESTRNLEPDHLND